MGLELEIEELVGLAASVSSGLEVTTGITVTASGTVGTTIASSAPTGYYKLTPSANTESHISIVRYPVYRGEVKNTHTVSAEVISNCPEIYIMEKTVEYSNKDEFIAKVALGEDVNTGDILYTIGGVEYASDCNARVVDIFEGDEKAIITLLNYDNLYAVMQVEEDKLTKIQYNTPVEVIIDGQSYSSEIKYIGYEVSNGMVDVYVIIPEKVLPGSEINAVFTLGVKAEGLYVSANAVYSDGNDLNYYNHRRMIHNDN